MNYLGGILAVVLFSSVVHAETWLRVRLMSLPSEVSLTGKSLSISKEPKPFKSVAIPRQESLSLRAKPGNLWQVRRGGSLQEIKSKALVLEGFQVRAGLNALPNRVLLSHRKDKIDVIGIFEIESYLKGVLPSEMPASWPVEALKAQAIAARSYALAKMTHREDESFHVESDIKDQVFNWKRLERNSRWSKKVEKVIEDTRGMVLIRNGSVHMSYYHADCGGTTESPSTIWGDVLKSGISEQATCRTRKGWARTIDLKDLEKRLAASGLAKDIKSVKVGSRSPSGRVSTVLLESVMGESISVSSHEFRKALGFGFIKSTMFSVYQRKGTLLFKGRGFGHGVGLCQYGTRDLAQAGWSHTQILNKYYPSARIKRYRGTSRRNAQKSRQKDGFLPKFTSWL